MQEDDTSNRGGDHGPMLPPETDEVSSESDSEDDGLCVQSETLRHSLPGNQTILQLRTPVVLLF